MTHHSDTHLRRSSLRTHLLLGLLLLFGGAVVAYWAGVRVAAWVAGAAIVTHLGLALLALLGFRLLWRAHAGRSNSQVPGQTIRWAGLYDVLVTVLTFGRERAFRNAVLERAKVSPGERVLDVGCGTGTLALVAKQRVGDEGTVHGIDAATEMVARARQKAARENLQVTFEVAPAQALPFPDGAFDVILCTLVLHHLPGDGREQAVAEMRRVLRPGGRLLIVDLARAKGLWAALNPISLVHGHDAMNASEDATTLMKDAGFSDIVTGKLRSRVYGYTLGTSGEQHA